MNEIRASEREGDSRLKKAAEPHGLTAKELRFDVSLDREFQSTSDYTAGQDFAGQERALGALDLGLGVTGSGYNVFATGLTGAEKLKTLCEWVAGRVSSSTPGKDWVYVHNFKNPDEPSALCLEAGVGAVLQDKMNHLVKTLKEELPKAFRKESFAKEKSSLREKFTQQAQEVSGNFEKLARDKGFLVQAERDGNVYFVPMINDQPMQSPEDLSQLSEEERGSINERQQELMKELELVTRKQREIMRSMETEVRAIERRFCERLLDPRLAEIKRQIGKERVGAYLNDVREHMLEHLDNFKDKPQGGQPLGFLVAAPEQAPSLEYEVNVVVDNAGSSRAPIIVEGSPSYLNLFGTIERVVDRSGRLVTNFTRIKAGSILKANGGYLIFHLDDAITEPAVWKTLKRTLKSGSIEMETYEPFAVFSTAGLRPQPIDINTKVIVTGSVPLFGLLYALDEEFREIFKIRADFRRAMELESDHIDAYVRWVGRLCEEEKLPHLDRSGLERLIVFGAREAGDRNKLLAVKTQVADLVRETAYWARHDDGAAISGRHVDLALEKRRFLSNRIEEEIRELITEGTLLIDIDGSKVGQVNGLSVMDLGGYAFGRPARVTASVAMGQGGILNIERESRLSGRIHDKGVLILAGYLRNRYGRDKPLALSASVCFEQSYGDIEGDSASSAELYALLSGLSGIPLRQDIAVTGSVNQWGQVQAIGGVNEKVEGFFDVCKVKGLTGKQGVMIPRANVRNVILRNDVLAAVAEGKFHVFPVQSIEEGLEILTGVKAGEVGENETVNDRVDRRLREMVLELRELVRTGKESLPSLTREAGDDASGNVWTARPQERLSRAQKYQSR